MYDILMIFVDFCWNFPWFWLIFCYPDPFYWSGSGSGWPKWNRSIRIRIRNTGYNNQILTKSIWACLKKPNKYEQFCVKTSPVSSIWTDRERYQKRNRQEQVLLIYFQVVEGIEPFLWIYSSFHRHLLFQLNSIV